MKILSIQYLRGLAVLLVVFAHAIDIEAHYGDPAIAHFFYLQNIGAIGVDLFFVISGFIITYITPKAEGFSDARQFLKKRFIRVNPLYYIATGILVFFYWTTIPGDPTRKFIFYGKSLVRDWLILPVKAHLPYPLLIPGWTLSFEWFFYLVFSVLIIFKAKNKAAWMTLIIISLVFTGSVLPVNDYRFIFATNPIMLEFILGVLIAWIYMHVKVGRNLALFLIIAATAAFLFYIFNGYGLISEGIYTLNAELSMKRFLLWGIPCGALVAGCILLEKNGKNPFIWKSRWASLIGDASYSIYLTHSIFLSALTYYYDQIGFPFGSATGMVIHIVFAVLTGIAFFWLVERPLLRLLGKKYNNREAGLKN